MTLVNDDTSRAAETPGTKAPNDAFKARHPSTDARLRPSGYKWTINALYGLGHDDLQFIVYRAMPPKQAMLPASNKLRQRSFTHKAVAWFPTLEGAMMWIIMRQVHFPDEPTIDTNILDAFQRYCHTIDQTKADIRALAERLETATAALAA